MAPAATRGKSGHCTPHWLLMSTLRFFGAIAGDPGQPVGALAIVAAHADDDERVVDEPAKSHGEPWRERTANMRRDSLGANPLIGLDKTW
jgi:hypothetical protein